MDIVEHRKKASDHSLGSSHSCIYKKALRILQSYPGAKRDFLDFGAGQGDFVSSVCRQNLFSSLAAIDLMEKPSSVDSKIVWLQGDLNESVAVDPESMDIVTALEVIEHLENPRHMLREIFRILRPGGAALVSTPNNESYRSLVSYVVRGHFVAFTDTSYPAHITPVNRKDLERAAKEAGFIVKGWDYTQQGALPGMTALSWQQLTLGLAKGLRFSDNLFVTLEKPT